MANDPNRDLLPVKDSDDRSNRGLNCRADHNIVAKMKRSDLEDKYMRLYDENTQIKKQLNCQDEKIKRLGTKLLRLIGEKKNCSESYGRKHDSKGLDELRMRIIELEHENYTLKDKNVVLKQQLANHARQHVVAHRSPNRSVHTSPRISHRQSSAPNVNENHPPDIQLREAEEHISGLNDEIKSLHNKIDHLQQDLEKSSLENQKTKVCENIELIRLQRSLKQQSIQIASLQAQIKNSERCQKLLREELATAHRENEESLQVISDKQKEILDLYTKLEEKNVCRLKEEEMKERIHDLTLERDTLKERGEFLMKSIEVKSSESDIVNDLKKLLATEKTKKEELKLSLEHTQRILQSLKNTAKSCHTSASDDALSGSSTQNEPTFEYKVLEDKEKMTIGVQTSISSLSLEKKNGGSELQLLASTQLVNHAFDEKSGSISSEKDSKSSVNIRNTSRSVGTYANVPLGCKCSESAVKEGPEQNIQRDSSTVSETEQEGVVGKSDSQKVQDAERINLGRELEYVKQMLRSQTQRCDSQEAEIVRLNSELRASEEKYQDTLKRLDLHLKIFRHLESRTSVASDDDGPNVDKGKEVYRNRIRTNSFSNNATYYNSRNSESVPNYESKTHFLQKKFLGSSDEDDDDDAEDELVRESLPTEAKSDKPLQRPEKTDLAYRKRLSEESGRKEMSSSSESAPQIHRQYVNRKDIGDDDIRPIPKPRKDVHNSRGSVSSEKKTHSGILKKNIRTGAIISLCIEWLKLEPNTSLWMNENVKLLFVDFSFLDVKGEETETPNSLRKPKKPVEKCHYNFMKTIEINEYRKNALSSVRNKFDGDLITFKVVSEPEESVDDIECVDVGVATVSVKQFFESTSNTSLLLQVRNINKFEEVIGILSVRIDISSIS